MSSPIVQTFMLSVNVYIHTIHSRIMTDTFVYSIEDNIFFPSGFSNVYLITSVFILHTSQTVIRQ